MQAQITELYKRNQTPAYADVINYYKQLDANYAEAKLVEYGPTDVGYPLQVLIIDGDKDFDPVKSRQKGKSILLINNGIHPGEPDGIDACIKFTDELFKSKNIQEQLKNIVICIIPVYNIDGSLNRNSTSRVNQNGPAEYGFRGNAQNYDLNRDFIKCDALNAQTFTKIFRSWDPDIFIDTHVSNGADYQYLMTLIATQHNKLSPPLGDYLKNKILPALYSKMDSAGFSMSPYVNPVKKTPDEGIVEFLETGRYSTGYAALFNTIGFMPETHMFKPYSQRVESTYQFIKIFVNYINSNAKEIIEKRDEAKLYVKMQKEFPLNWQPDTTQKENFLFKGYKAEYKQSDVSGMQRLYYNRNAPYEKNISFYSTYKVTQKINAPKQYIIPQAWRNVIERLQLNKINITRLDKDTMLEAEYYYITKYETVPYPYEGHYLHYNVEVRTEKQKILFRKGDYIISLNQDANRYIVETLEPQAADSYFAWNFFDAILMEKEYFSDYVFEDIAAGILKENIELKNQLEEKKKADAAFAKDAEAQLYFIYQNSKYYERSHNLYPVYRIN